MSRASAAAAKSERPMTKRDWGALYLAWRLCEQIVLHGHRALDDFIDAMVELRATQPTQDGGYDMTAEATAKGIAQLVHRPAVSEAREEPKIRAMSDEEARERGILVVASPSAGREDYYACRDCAFVTETWGEMYKHTSETAHSCTVEHRPAPSSAGTPAVSEVEARMRAVLRPSPFDPSRVDELTEAQAVALYRALVREWPQVATAPSPARAVDVTETRLEALINFFCDLAERGVVIRRARSPEEWADDLDELPTLDIRLWEDETIWDALQRERDALHRGIESLTAMIFEQRSGALLPPEP